MTFPAHDQPHVDAVVSLRDVTRENFRAVCALKVRPKQEENVASNAFSIAEAHFSPAAWFRAIYADETPVGFVMLRADQIKGEYVLWRFMIDARYQGSGYGRRALVQIIEHVRHLTGAAELCLHYVPGPHAPDAFYRRLGFSETGRLEGVQREMRLLLTNT
jgi:diamine N-acetyltransferase